MDMYKHMHMNMCIDMRTGIWLDMCMDIGPETDLDMRITMYKDMHCGYLCTPC